MTLTTEPVTTPELSALSGLILTTGDRAVSDTHEDGVLGGDVLTGGQRAGDAQEPFAPGDILDPDPTTTDTDSRPVGVDTSAGGQLLCDSQRCPAPGMSCPPDPTNMISSPMVGPSGGWAALRLLAEMYEDAQRSRIGCENRVRSATVDPDLTAASLDALGRAEHELKKALQAQYKRTVPAPIQAWAKDTRGIGKTSPHMLARLLGVIGHPVIATPHHWEGEGSDRVLVADPPFARNVAKLWAYCGHGDPNRKRAKGMTAPEAARLGNPRAKMLTHLLAEAVIKSSNPDYRIVYDARRETTAVTHPDWSKGHSHNDALHLVGKEILRDLWTAAMQE